MNYQDGFRRLHREFTAFEARATSDIKDAWAEADRLRASAQFAWAITAATVSASVLAWLAGKL